MQCTCAKSSAGVDFYAPWLLERLQSAHDHATLVMKMHGQSTPDFVAELDCSLMSFHVRITGIAKWYAILAYVLLGSLSDQVMKRSAC